MLHTLKKRLFFILARYFSFWAKIVLKRWKPRVIVVTGSSGKTTVLHLIETQLGDRAVYSHYANSAFGVPFHILGMNPNVGSRLHWLAYALKAPIKVFRGLPQQKFYVVEADCDRPGEGKLLASLLKPEVTIWVSVFRTHSMNFDKVVGAKFATHEEAIAYEFGHFAEKTSKLIIANGDQPVLISQLKRRSKGARLKLVSNGVVKNYRVTKNNTTFDINGATFELPGFQPKELGISLQMVSELLAHLNLELDKNFSGFQTPPGRNSVFNGIKNTVLVDSTYNTGLGATKAVIEPFMAYPNQNKWLVIGDILEQGSLEKSEHENLAKLILEQDVERVILIGPRTKKFTAPIVKQARADLVLADFEMPNEVLQYLKAEIKGGELILFKGGRYLEGVIEQLLADSQDSKKLVRRGPSWEKRRQKWGLPK